MADDDKKRTYRWYGLLLIAVGLFYIFGPGDGLMCKGVYVSHPQRLGIGLVSIIMGIQILVRNSKEQTEKSPDVKG